MKLLIDQMLKGETEADFIGGNRISYFCQYANQCGRTFLVECIAVTVLG